MAFLCVELKLWVSQASDEFLHMEMTLGYLVHAPDLPLTPPIHPHSCPVPCLNLFHSV